MPSSGVKKCALRSEEHTSELQSHDNLVCRLLIEKTQSAVAEARGLTPSSDRAGLAGGAGRGVWAREVGGTPRAEGIVWASGVSVFFFLKERAPPVFSPFPHPPPFPL